MDNSTSSTQLIGQSDWALEDKPSVFGEAYFEQHKNHLAEQINKLQQRQLALAQQTTEELDNLRRQIESAQEWEKQIIQEKEPLKEEIARLRDTIQSLEQENSNKDQQLEELQQLYQSQYSQIQGVFDSLKNIVRGQVHALDQQIRVFSLDANQSLDNLLEKLDNSQIPLPNLETKLQATPKTPPGTIASAFPDKDEKRVEPEKKNSRAQSAGYPLQVTTDAAPIVPAVVPKKEKAVTVKSKVKMLPRLIRLTTRSLILASFLAIAFYGWQYVHPIFSKPDHGQVAGVTTSSLTDNSGNQNGSNANSTQNEGNGEKVSISEYAESFAEIPFAQTVWDEFKDPDFGLSLDYPKNTTNKVRVIGGSNLWLLRKNGYLLKVSRIDTTDTLDAWWEKNKKDYAEGYSYNKGSFKNQPAIVGQPVQHDNTTGTQYFMRRGSVIFQIWIKEEPPTTDDGQRIGRMLDSLKFSED